MWGDAESGTAETQVALLVTFSPVLGLVPHLHFSNYSIDSLFG